MCVDPDVLYPNQQGFCCTVHAIVSRLLFFEIKQPDAVAQIFVVDVGDSVGRIITTML